MTDSKPKDPVVLPSCEDMLLNTKARAIDLIRSAMLEAADEGRTYLAVSNAAMPSAFVEELEQKGYLIETHHCADHPLDGAAVISWDGPALDRLIERAESQNPMRALMNISGSSASVQEVKPS